MPVGPAYEETIRITAEDQTAAGVASAETRMRSMASRLAGAARIPITIIDRATAPLRGILGLMGGIATSALSFAIGQALYQLPRTLYDAATAAAFEVQTQVQLRRALENTGASWAQYGTQLEGVATDAGRLGFSDEETRQSLALLLAQTNSATEAQYRLSLAQDLARGTGMDLMTASKLLGKANEENANVLARYGIVMRQGATDTELLAAVRAKFGGQSAAFANSVAGQWAAVQQQLEQFRENVGRVALPLLERLARFANTVLVPAMQQYLVPAIDAAGTAIGELADRFGPGVGGALLGIWTAVQPGLTWLWQVALPALGREFLDFVGWVQGRLLPQLRQLWEWLSPRLKPVAEWLIYEGWPRLRAALGTIWDFLTTSLLPKLGELWDWLSPKLQGAIEWWKTEAWPRLQTPWGAIRDFLGDPDNPTTLLGRLNLLKQWLWDKMQGAIDWTVENWPKFTAALSAAGDAVRTNALPVFEPLATAVNTIATALKEAQPAWTAFIALFTTQGPQTPMDNLRIAMDSLGTSGENIATSWDHMKRAMDALTGSADPKANNFNYFAYAINLWSKAFQGLTEVARIAALTVESVTRSLEVLTATYAWYAETRQAVEAKEWGRAWEILQRGPEIRRVTPARETAAATAPPLSAAGGTVGAEPAITRQAGGWLLEPILGVGLDSRRTYSFVENRRPEYVLPASNLRTPPPSSSSQGGAATRGVAVHLQVAPGAVQITGAAGPAETWATAAEGLWEDLEWRLRHALSNRTLGDGRSSWRTTE